MKWYTALSSYSSSSYTNMLDVAVASCLANTPFKPHIICDKKIPYTKKLEKQYKDKIKVIYHSGKIFKSFCKQFKNDNQLANQLGTAGTYLRAEVPIIETQDKYVLYTDADVIFYDPKNGPRDVPAPDYFAAAPEFDYNNWSYFNAGSMIMNTESMREQYNTFYNYVKDKFKQLVDHAHDQAAYNLLFKGKWNRLPVEYNWKPGWGVNDRAVVVHFHGPKPDDVRKYFNNELTDVNIDVSVDGLQLYKSLIQRDVSAYKKYLDDYDSFVKEI